MNNSLGFFSCIRAGANTGATCICTEMSSLKNLDKMQRIIPQKYFPVFARLRIQAPEVFTQKLTPQLLSCMYWFCAGGILNLNTINSLNCNLQQILEIPEGNGFCN